jgi:hypothetical protein
MIPTLALTLALAAPVPKVAPFPLLTDPLPKEFKPDTLADEALPRSIDGKVHLLAWETVESDRPSSSTRVVVLKAFDKADEKGNKFALCFMYWEQNRGEWWYRLIPPPAPAPGEKLVVGSDAFHMGCQQYVKPPTDKELAAFLKDVDWAPKLGQEVEEVRGLKRPVTTKLAAGGFDLGNWKTHFDRDPPVELFAELKK